MNLDTSKWKYYKVGDLFNKIYKAKKYNREDLTETDNVFENKIRYITRTGENNGCECFVADSDYEGLEKENAITIGDTTATCFYQNEPFICGDHMVVLRSDFLTENIGLFLISLLNNESYRYNYGRAFVIELIKNTELLLPALTDTVPDWEFMENYIKSLHSKPITTKNKNNHIIFYANTWKWFDLKKLFYINAGKYHYSEEYNVGKTNYITASNENNGISLKINLEPEFKGNCIITGKVGCNAFYQNEEFCATSDINILRSKYINFNQHIGLFITTIINFSENYKWNYGRQCRINNCEKIKIKLPIKYNSDNSYFIDENKTYSEEGFVPDWEFMENYIKSLPYGDRI